MSFKDNKFDKRVERERASAMMWQNLREIRCDNLLLLSYGINYSSFQIITWQLQNRMILRHLICLQTRLTENMFSSTRVWCSLDIGDLSMFGYVDTTSSNGKVRKLTNEVDFVCFECHVAVVESRNVYVPNRLNTFPKLVRIHSNLGTKILIGSIRINPNR